jgi:hypothetical protein
MSQQNWWIPKEEAVRFRDMLSLFRFRPAARFRSELESLLISLQLPPLTDRVWENLIGAYSRVAKEGSFAGVIGRNDVYAIIAYTFGGIYHPSRKPEMKQGKDREIWTYEQFESWTQEHSYILDSWREVIWSRNPAINMQGADAVNHLAGEIATLQQLLDPIRSQNRQVPHGALLEFFSDMIDAATAGGKNWEEFKKNNRELLNKIADLMDYFLTEDQPNAEVLKEMKESIRQATGNRR